MDYEKQFESGLGRQEFTELIALAIGIPQRIYGMGEQYSLASVSVVWTVAAFPGITSNGLIFKTKYSMRTVSRSVRKLISEGWIEQQTDPLDRRLKHHFITTKCREELRKAQDEMGQHLVRLMAEAGVHIKIAERESKHKQGNVAGIHS